MIVLALAFVFGAFCLQQMPVLPSLYWALAFIPLLLIQIKLVNVNQHFLAYLTTSTTNPFKLFLRVFLGDNIGRNSP